MDLEQARQDILSWIIDFVEQPNAQLAGWAPCPFARQARLSGKIDIRSGVDPYTDLMQVCMDSYDVLVYVYDASKFHGNEFIDLVGEVNREFLIAKNMIALSDHPDHPETVNGVSMNQGQFAIAFVQELTKLNRFARQLAEKKYYDKWPESYLKELFENREDPRS